MPNIPKDIYTDIRIDTKGLVKLLLLSIALEELSIAKLLNSEGEMMQEFLRKCYTEPINKEEMARFNKTVSETLRIIYEKEKTLQEKLRLILSFQDDLHCHLEEL